MELESKFICNYLESIKLYTLEVPVNIENVLKLFGVPIEEQGIKEKKIMTKQYSNYFLTNHGPSRSEKKEIQDELYVIN